MSLQSDSWERNPFTRQKRRRIISRPSDLSPEAKKRVLEMASIYDSALIIEGVARETIDDWERGAAAIPGQECDLFFNEIRASDRLQVIGMLETIKRAAIKSQAARKAFNSPAIQRWVDYFEIRPEELED